MTLDKLKDSLLTIYNYRCASVGNLFVTSKFGKINYVKGDKFVWLMLNDYDRG